MASVRLLGSGEGLGGHCCAWNRGWLSDPGDEVAIWWSEGVGLESGDWVVFCGVRLVQHVVRLTKT